MALLAVVVAFAVWRFWVPPSVAADLPQESAKYAVGAFNLYRTGCYEVMINHRSYPADGGLGYGLLIVPSLWFAGAFIGNTIYTQLILAVAVCAGLYLAMRLCFGVWAALLAGAAPPLYWFFYVYSRMLDTSIPTAFFLVAGLLIFLRILSASRGSFFQWMLWGLCAGWAMAVRSNNAVVFLVLTVGLVRLSPRKVWNHVRNFGAAAIGAAPLVLPWFWYNHHYCGAWLRDPHAYWSSNPFDNLSRVFGLRCPWGLPNDSLAMNDRGNLFFYGREIVYQFITWQSFDWHFGLLRRGLIFTASGVMLVGVLCLFRCARTDSRARHFLWYSLIAIGTTLSFYSFCEFRASRYMVPLAPFCAAFIGIGVVDTVRGLWLRKHTATLISLFLLIIAGYYYTLIRIRVEAPGDVFPVADILRHLQSRIESNAVIISNIYPPQLELALVQGTQRQIVLLKGKILYRVQPRPPRDPSRIPDHITDGYAGDLENGAMDIFDFSALEDPIRIQQLLDNHAPVYVIDQTMGTLMNEDLAALNRNFELALYASIKTSGRVRTLYGVADGPIVWRLRSRISPSRPQ